MFFLVFPVLALIAASADLAWTSRVRQGWRVAARILLRYVLVVNVGLEGWAAFCGHAFFSAQVSHSIGWEPSPFEFEVAIANLAFGTLGVLCVWKEGDFWTAVVIGVAIWLWGDAIGHIKEIIVARNYAPNNAGVALYSDLLLPALLIALFALGRAPASRAHQRDTGRGRSARLVAGRAPAGGPG